MTPKEHLKILAFQLNDSNTHNGGKFIKHFENYLKIDFFDEI